MRGSIRYESQAWPQRVYLGKLAVCLAALLMAGILLPPAAAAAADSWSTMDFRRWEIGLGGQGGWTHLQEATASDPFGIEESLGYGIVLGAARRLTPRVSLALEFAVGAHDTSLPELSGTLSTISLGFHYTLLQSGGILPYLRGSFGGAGMKIKPTDGGGESLDLFGMVGIFGAGLRLAPSRRLQFDLELNHGVINYRDASVTLESVYTGTRIDKAGRVTRLQIVALLMI